MNFGWAIEAAKRGKKVARTGWNGKGMFVFIAFGGQVKIDGRRHVDIFDVDGPPMVEANGSTKTRVAPCFVMKAADGSLVPGWLASQTDMLAEDWLVV